MSRSVIIIGDEIYKSIKKMEIMNFRAKIGIKEIQAHYYFGAKIQIFLARFFSRFDIIDNFPTI